MPSDRIGRCDDGGSSRKCAHDPSFSQTDALLLHGLQKSLMLAAHLIKLINTTDTWRKRQILHSQESPFHVWILNWFRLPCYRLNTLISQHQRSSLQSVISRSTVPGQRYSESWGGGGVSTNIYAPWSHVTHGLDTHNNNSSDKLQLIWLTDKCIRDL